jgi:antitoxin CptB
MQDIPAITNYSFFMRVFIVTEDILPRLRWSCRRGMLELDVLLGNFLEEAYLQLSSDDQLLFVKLLECGDQELFDWLTGKKQSHDAEFVRMVERIRLHAQNRH